MTVPMLPKAAKHLLTQSAHLSADAYDIFCYIYLQGQAGY